MFFLLFLFVFVFLIYFLSSFLKISAYPGSKSLAPLFDATESQAGVTNSPYPANSVSNRIGNVSVRQLRGMVIAVKLSVLNYESSLCSKT